MELDMDGYMALGYLRRAFDDWLRQEGLIDQMITAIRFDEGYVRAFCLTDLPHSIDGEWRDFPVSAPPPPEVMEAIYHVSRGGLVTGTS